MWHKGYPVCLFLHGNYCYENCSSTEVLFFILKPPQIYSILFHVLYYHIKIYYTIYKFTKRGDFGYDKKRKK
jgi:hypothetical protein